MHFYFCVWGGGGATPSCILRSLLALQLRNHCWQAQETAKYPPCYAIAMYFESSTLLANLSKEDWSSF